MLFYIVLRICALFLVDSRSKQVNKNGDKLHFTKFHIWPKFYPKSSILFSWNLLTRFTEILNDDRVLEVNNNIEYFVRTLIDPKACQCTPHSALNLKRIVFKIHQKGISDIFSEDRAL